SRARSRPGSQRLRPHHGFPRPDPMTTLLATPADWPRILLARVPSDGTVAASAAIDLAAARDAGAFEGLRIAIEEIGADGTIAAIEQSGLRGRGGAGHPTSAKWR